MSDAESALSFCRALTRELGPGWSASRPPAANDTAVLLGPQDVLIGCSPTTYGFVLSAIFRGQVLPGRQVYPRHSEEIKRTAFEVRTVLAPRWMDAHNEMRARKAARQNAEAWVAEVAAELGGMLSSHEPSQATVTHPEVSGEFGTSISTGGEARAHVVLNMSLDSAMEVAQWLTEHFLRKQR